MAEDGILKPGLLIYPDSPAPIIRNNGRNL